jgi:hypothetical protein
MDDLNCVRLSIFENGSIVPQMTATAVSIYTLPGCTHCEALKTWLKKEKIPFDERLFDTDAQVRFIMNNLFSDPPILEMSSRILTPDEIFRGEEVNEELLRAVINENDKKKG